MVKPECRCWYPSRRTIQQLVRQCVARRWRRDAPSTRRHIPYLGASPSVIRGVASFRPLASIPNYKMTIGALKWRLNRGVVSWCAAVHAGEP